MRISDWSSDVCSSDLIADEQLAENAIRAVRVQEIQEMPGPHRMHRGEQQVLLARNERILRRLVPARVGRRDVIDRSQAFLIGAGNVDIGGVLPVRSDERRVGKEGERTCSYGE